MTQKEKVLRHLRDYGNITSWQAFEEYGITRLSAVIYTLRKSGFNITSFLDTRINRYGECINFARYSFNYESAKKEPQNFLGFCRMISSVGIE